MSSQIHCVGFRNAIYMGQTISKSQSGEIPAGIGILLDDMFLTCISEWKSNSSGSPNEPEGPTVLIYPHRQILYTDEYPVNNKLSKFWCYIFDEYMMFGVGENCELAVLHFDGQIVSHIKNTGGEIKYEKQYVFGDEVQKWKVIEQILSIKIDEQKRSLKKFIETNFSNRLNYLHKENYFINQRFKHNEDVFGILANTEGIILCIKKQAKQIGIISTGYHRNYENSKNTDFGRKYLKDPSSSSVRIIEGNFQSQDLFQFQIEQKRPAESYKTCRKFYKQTTNFCNQFLHLNQADETYKRLSRLSKQYKMKIGTKYGQQIIEGKKIESFKHQPLVQKNVEENVQLLQLNREYNLNEAKAMIQFQIGKKRMSSRTKTGAFSSSRRNQYEKSPISNKNYYNATSNKVERSPLRSSPRKYRYFEKETGDNSRKQKNQERFTNFNGLSYHLQPKQVNQFTLYPNQQIQTDRLDYIIRQKQMHLMTDREAQKQRIMKKMERQIQRQTEFEMRTLRQIENYDEMHKIIGKEIIDRENLSREILERQRSKRDTLFPKYSIPTDLNINSLEVPNSLRKMQTDRITPYPSQEHQIKRKYFHNYNYTDGKEEAKRNENLTEVALRSQNENKIPGLSGPSYPRTQNRPVSRSPITSRGRKGYSYMD